MADTGAAQREGVGLGARIGVTDDNRRWWVLGGMGLTLFMVLFDETVVGVALDTIQRDLGMTDLQGHWVVNSYLLALAAFVAIGGRFADLFGYRRVFVIGAVVFGLASLAGAMAADGTMLLVARTIQGLGAAVVFPLSLALVMIVFPVEQRGVAIGVYGALGTAGLALGPLAGGLLTEYLSWRWIFTVNVVAAGAIILLLVLVWREPARPPRRPLDLRGLATLAVSLAALVLAIMQGEDWGWSSPATITLLVLSVVGALAFWRIESHAEDPLIDVDLFRSSSFTAFNAGVFLGQFSKSTVIVFLPLYLQQVLGYSAIEAGLALMPGMITTVLAAMPAGRWVDRAGPGTPLLAGLVALVVTHVALAALVDVDDYLLLLPVLVVWGPATVLVFQGSLTGVANAVPVERQGQASGISNEAQMLGGALGVAAMSALQISGDRWDVVFGAAALVAVAVLAFGIAAIDRSRPAAAPAPPAPSGPLVGRSRV